MAVWTNAEGELEATALFGELKTEINKLPIITAVGKWRSFCELFQYIDAIAPSFTCQSATSFWPAWRRTTCLGFFTCFPFPLVVLFKALQMAPVLGDVQISLQRNSFRRFWNSNSAMRSCYLYVQLIFFLFWEKMG